MGFHAIAVSRSVQRNVARNAEAARAKEQFQEASRGFKSEVAAGLDAASRDNQTDCPNEFAENQ